MKTLLAIFIVIAIASNAHAAATLVWKDNSTNEDGFNIYRKLESETDFRIIGTTAANVAKFADPEGTGGACYKVTAFNKDGESTFSNTACALHSPTSLILLLVLP